MAPTGEELQRLNRLVLWAFVIRAIVAIALDSTGYASALAPDETTYASNGWYLSLYWAGEVFFLPARLTIAGTPKGYFYVNGALFWLFGQTQIPIKLLNAFLGAFAGRYVYLLARGLYGPAVAKRATTFFLFFPSMILWSSVNIRDIWMILLILVVAWRSYVLLNQYSTKALVQLIGAIFLVSLFRDHLLVAIAAPPVLALMIGRRGNLGRKLVVSLLLGGALIALLGQGSASEAIESKMSFDALAATRRNLATGASVFQEGASVSTPSQAIAFLPVGLAYFFWSPFPWQITSLLKALSSPEMLGIYYLTPAMIRGLLWTIRFRLRESLQVLLVTGLMTLTYTLGEGNVGTLYRHRAQTTAFYLMFAAVGIEVRRGAVGRRPDQIAFRPART
jgi:hypothetical protein